jgi:hypothetical protein
MRYRYLRQFTAAFVTLAAASLFSVKAYAVPSFARQTGLACTACHTVFPELTHFGRMFKANGYTLDNLKQVRDINSEKEDMLLLSTLAPLSAMVEISQSWLKQPLPDLAGAGTHSQTSTTGFPQQLSLFYAGKIAPHLGAMIQVTYDNGSGSIGIDNTDIRFANSLLLADDRPLVYGISLNNNPTVQDLWNTTPAWGYPYASSNAVLSPIAAAQIDGTLAQDVAGASIYVMWNESLYGEAGIYHSAKQGATNAITGAAGPLDGTSSNVIASTAPYGRIAYEHQWGRHDIEIGVYGASFRLYPGGTAGAPVPLTGPVNRFDDVGEDLQYQFIGERDLLTLQATHIHESMHLGASFAADVSANPTDTLSTTRIDGSYYFERRYGLTLGYFSTIGSADPGLYPATPAPGAVTSANGRPDMRAWISELNYMPWLNVKLSLQHVMYQSFNGGRTNYDGFGRNASANDSTYMLLWVAF